MEVSNSALIQSAYIENQYGRSFVPAQAFNVINDSILNLDASLSELAIEFIQSSFKEIQISRAEALKNGNLEVKATLMNVQTKGFGPNVKRFFEEQCQIDLNWTIPSNDCYKINIYSSVNLACFSDMTNPPNNPFSEKVDTSIKLFQDNISYLDYLLGYFAKNEKFPDKFSNKISIFVHDIFKSLEIERQKALKENKINFYTSTITRDYTPPNYLQIPYSLVEAVSLFFQSYLGMKAEGERLPGNYTDYTLTTYVCNPCFKPVNPKPPLTPLIENKTCFDINDSEFSDITFLFKEGKVNAHKVIFSRSPVLKKMFSEKFKSEGIIPFHLCEHETFLAFKEFVYTGNLDPKYMEDYQNCLKLILFSHLIDYKPIGIYAKNALYNKMNEVTFVEIASLAAQIKDEYLLNLCKWFAIENPEFGNDLEFSDFLLEHLVILLQSVIKNYNLPILKKTLIETFTSSLKLDEDFQKICNLIYEKKDSELKVILRNTLLEKPNLLQTLRDNKLEKEYCDMWTSFHNLFTAIEI